MIGRLAAVALLIPVLSACCCPRTERCGSDPCGPSDSGPVVASRITNFDFVLDPPVQIQNYRGVEIVPTAPPPAVARGPRVEVRISMLEMNVPMPPIVDFEALMPTAAAIAAAKPVLVVHAVADLVGGDAVKIDALLEKIRAIVVGVGESASAQGLVAIVVKTSPSNQTLVDALLNKERAAAGLPLPPPPPVPVQAPDPK